MNAEVTYPRETLRAYFYLRHVSKCLRYVAAGFFKGHVSEATLCSPFPLIPGYKNLCNFSDVTYGNSWYCGRPRKLGLTCADWHSVRDMEFTRPFALSDVDMSLTEQLRKPPLLRLIPSTVILHVDKGTPIRPEKACPGKHFQDTWQLDRPRGYFLHKQWVRSDCRRQWPDPPTDAACLTNTTIVFTGDSNFLSWFVILKSRLGCELVIEQGTTTWHRPRSCVRADVNFHMSWRLHGFPNHPVSDHWAPRSDFLEVTDQLDSVPDRGRYVVAIHLFLHYSIHHYSVLYSRLLAVRKAAESLLDRNPDALVMVRGPHTAYSGWPPVLGGDMAGPLMRELTVRAFRGVHERVLYLDFWDMSTASENSEFHPELYINEAMVQVFLDHVCSNS
ncbi:NXPE family member 3-like [Aplysia californica]|uniref:NXPE family member 3-like n=1 Tax=Aplysia californica TaxID=6500 RepID=A0ABM1AD83_APLCA|nr:NXPE family member 3-like [Aplysia californica]